MKPEDKELALITIASLCILSLSFLPTYLKTLFVSENGKLEVIWAPIVGVFTIDHYLYPEKFENLQMVYFTIVNTFSGVLFTS